MTVDDDIRTSERRLDLAVMPPPRRHPPTQPQLHLNRPAYGASARTIVERVMLAILVAVLILTGISLVILVL